MPTIVLFIFLVNKVLSRYYSVMSAEEIHNHIERLSNLLRAESRKQLTGHGLQPVQLEVLHYLSVCNRYSNTGKGVAEYLGQTKGTVSQSIKVLERKGLVTKHVDNADKRIVHLIISNSARKLLKNTVPASLFSNACKRIKKQSMSQIINALASLLLAVQRANGLKSFGVCYSCRHNKNLNNGNYLCGLTKEVLTSNEVQLICREHDNCEQISSV